MGIHHVALATADLGSTHAFYTEAMGFELAKVVTTPTPGTGDGWAKHVFYDTGGDGLIAFWDLHDDTLPAVDGAMSRAVGLPEWVNHLAFDAVDETTYDGARKRWLDLGLDVFEVDHEFCRSIYTLDPNGTMVEWCLSTRALDDRDRADAVAALATEGHGEFDPTPEPVFHRGDRSLRPAWAT